MYEGVVSRLRHLIQPGFYLLHQWRRCELIDASTETVNEEGNVLWIKRYRMAIPLLLCLLQQVSSSIHEFVTIDDATDGASIKSAEDMVASAEAAAGRASAAAKVEMKIPSVMSPAAASKRQVESPVPTMH